ncbi:16S rRNA (cytidine(1402)-2'-O)-methyltransferase [Salinisphaera orenii]|uniref:Ribosomal RNA small subunit methyltransferase I n=1 Tax=Salinisphaera orenii YIM 95161 TaxID=1051139 RepID=A0A423QAP8_9GAMM|nr:16S rRNA (cytidine(1402)-2'-O)-methyltransferase [Salinisphaera halophila]ROO37668.1 16S rRNA methyltransferase [Salinisphaera halophila YIM 95161]
MTATPAMLWIVATPIGNLEDIAARAARVLSEVAVIAAEDTRHSARLTEHLAIGTPMLSLHEYNEAERVPQLIGRLQAGEAVALISDAGTPLISDPGFALVRAARAEGIEVRCVPGACAAVAALSVAGLPSDRFVFEGFLPARAAGRRARLAELADETRTLLFYESSHRIAAAVSDIAATLGEQRPVTLCRELTKLHEQSVQLPAEALSRWLAFDANRRRGEFVLVVGGAPVVERHAVEVTLDGLLAELLAVTGTKDAAGAAARLLGVSRNAAYARALELQ